MEYDVPDSSGTDDDIPPPIQNRVARGSRVTVNGRSSLGSAPSSRVHTDMEAQVHHIEQEAYCSVLRAFKVQSDAISWEKESLITELRKELKVSDDEHRKLLSRVNGDDIIRRIRDWRVAGGNLAARHNVSQSIHEVLPTPSMSASRKKQRTSQLQGQILPGLAPANTMPYLSAAPTGSGQQFAHRNSSGTLPGIDAEADPWIGKKVWTRWPEDNFYEAVITDYNPVERLYDAVNVILSYQVHHQASVCPLRLVAYRFCGVMVQAGSSSIDVRDRMRGLSEHESICRSRMAPCDSCGRSVML